MGTRDDHTRSSIARMRGFKLGAENREGNFERRRQFVCGSSTCGGEGALTMSTAVTRVEDDL
jgi:hypothetical protein